MGELSSRRTDQPRGIHDVTSDFRETYRELGLGVKDAKLRGIGSDDWKDLYHDVVAEAWILARRNPSYFAPGVARRWARVAGYIHWCEFMRKKGRRVLFDEALQREFLAGNFAVASRDFLEDEMRAREIVKAWQLLPPGSRLVLRDVLDNESSRSEAAEKHGKSERAVKRMVEKGRRTLRSALAHLMSDESNARSRTPMTDGEGGGK